MSIKNMIFTSGLSKPEGPVLLKDHSWIVAEMGINRGCVTRIKDDGSDIKKIVRTGCPNGIAIDCHGVIWVAESNPDSPSLLRVGFEGQVKTFLNSCKDNPLLFPNDLVFGPEGNLYMTDSGIARHVIEPDGKLCDDYLNLETDGKIFRINTNSGKVEIFDSGLKFANGIAFDQHNNLFVCETFSGWIYKYQRVDNMTFSRREKFANVIGSKISHDFCGPDGMAFDLDGKLYVAVFGQGMVVVLNPDGSINKEIETRGKFPTNVAFGPSRSKRIFVTECEYGAIEMFDTSQDGLPLYT